MTGNFKRQLSTGISTFAIAAALGLATPAMAQTDVSTLTGHVAGAKAGTAVVATDTRTGQRSTGTVDEGGNYTILGLRPSTYTVTVEGMPAQTTTLLVGQTGSLDFGQEGGTIVVTGRAGVREVRTQTVSTNITPAQIENLPQNQRNFLSFANLAPGLQVAPGGPAQVQAGALSSANVNVLLDGMSFKNPINHGGVFGQNFGLGNPFPQIAIQEYQIQTQNFGAETGQAGSALLTAITKTGGNHFHGSAFIEYQPNSFIEQPYFDKLNHVPKPQYSRKQFGGDLGGPIIADRLFFYIAGEGTIENLPNSTGEIHSSITVPANVVAAVNVPHNKDFKQGLYFGKLTYLATDADTINLEAFIRRENNLTDIDTNAASTHGRTILTHQDRYQAQWKHSSGDFLNLFNIAYDKATQSTPSVGNGPEFLLGNTTTGDVIAQLGSHFFTQGDTQKSWVVKDDMTLRRGEHTFKAGAQATFYDLSRSVSNSFNGRYYFQNPGTGANFDPTTAIPYQAQINVEPSPMLKAKDTQLGVYVQDEWKPDQHWTVNLGIRWDFESNANNNNYVTPTAIANALRNYAGWQARGINANDYISTGNNRKPVWDEFQPRVGFAYDVHGDRDLVIFGGAGRYYDRPLFIEGVIETLTNSNRILTVNFCQNGQTTNCTPFTSALRDPNQLRAVAAAQAAGGGGDVWVLNNKTRMPFSDQFDLGIRKRFGPITASLTFSHIRSHNIFMFTRANFYANGWYTRIVTRDANGNVTGCSNGGDAWIQDFIPNGLTNANGTAVPTSVCAAQNGQLPGFSGKLNRGANDGRADYNALYLQVEKPFTDRTRWGFTSSLTIQDARSNVAQELNNDEFFNGASQTAYGWGNVNGVPKWTWVTAANFRAPYGFILSGQLTLNSGPAFGNIYFGTAPDGACCYANMGGVYFPKPFIGYKRLDLRVAKTFKLPWGSEVTADFQAFNVFNWLNRTYSSWGSGGGNPPSRIENGQVGNDARSFQAGLKFSF